MAKINFADDLTKDLSHLDILLFKNRGWKAAWKRFHIFQENDKFDDCALVTKLENKIILFRVNEKGVLSYSWSKEELNGHLRWMLDAKSINLNVHPESSARARNAIGATFKGNAHAIAHVFCLPNPHLADVNTITEQHNYLKNFGK
jgi:hypothetical protein